MECESDSEPYIHFIPINHGAYRLFLMLQIYYQIFLMRSMHLSAKRLPDTPTSHTGDRSERKHWTAKIQNKKD